MALFDPRTIGGDPAAAVRLLPVARCRVIVFTSSLLTGEAAVLRDAGGVAVALRGMEVAALLALLESVLAG